jgi:hypothetical protein
MKKKGMSLHEIRKQCREEIGDFSSNDSHKMETSPEGVLYSDLTIVTSHQQY